MLNKKTILLTASIFILTIALVGCGKSIEEKAAEKYIEGVTGSDVNFNKEGVEIKDDDGNVISTKSGKTLPSEWPKEVPYYKKDKIVQSTFMVLPAGKTFSIIIMTDDSREDVIKFFKEELEKVGFKSTLEMETDQSYLLGGEKDDLSVTINLSEEDGALAITQVVGQEL